MQDAVSFARALAQGRRARGLSQQQIADLCGVSRAAVAQWEAASTVPDPARWRALADGLGLDVAGLLGASAARPGTVAGAAAPADAASLPVDLPVLGLATGGDGGDLHFNGETVDRVRRPPALIHARNAFALYVVGESMSPRYEPGELVFVHPGQHPRAGDDVVLELTPDREGAAAPCFIKRYLRRTGEALICAQFNPARHDLRYPLDRLRSLYRILPVSELFRQ